MSPNRTRSLAAATMLPLPIGAGAAIALDRWAPLGYGILSTMLLFLLLSVIVAARGNK